MAQVLIIDDDDRFRGVMKEMLSRSGYDVLTAANGKIGIGLYREKRPDLVITDVIMPDKDGAEVIFELQKEFPDVKIIVMTGGGQGDAQTYLKSIIAYSNVKYGFEKPFAMNDLLKAVKELIG
jgi:DNA-binding NtrC family response regulator